MTNKSPLNKSPDLLGSYVDSPLGISVLVFGKNGPPNIFEGVSYIGSDATQVHSLNTQLDVNGSNSLSMKNAPAGVSGDPFAWIQININNTLCVFPVWIKGGV